MRVAIIGAGVVGLTTAVALKESFPNLDVTVFADSWSPDTTGDGSAGLWSPYITADTPLNDVLRWAGSTHRWFHEHWRNGLSSDIGLSLIPVYRVTKSEVEGSLNAYWKNIPYGCHKLKSEELQRLNGEQAANYRAGYHFVTYTCEPKKLLPWLLQRFRGFGGKTVKRKIHNFEELFRENYDCIINCTGLGARELIRDSFVTPVRGQVARVEAPWIFAALVVDDDDGNYIIPNSDSVILGGTHQEGDYDTSIKQEDSEFIFEGCFRILPSLKKAPILKEWVGLRPGRQSIRLEAETIFQQPGKRQTVIHNYGHGGSGVTLCWGCALEVVEILRSKFHRSKL